MVIYVYVHICRWWLYMFMCIYVVGGDIYYVHICCWWLYMLCAYMLLVNFFYMLLVANCWCKHVLEYVGVDLWNSYEVCFVVVEF